MQAFPNFGGNAMSWSADSCQSAVRTSWPSNAVVATYCSFSTLMSLDRLFIRLIEVNGNYCGSFA
jgi:hypothetical protein